MFAPIIAQRSVLRAVGIAPTLRRSAAPLLAQSQRRWASTKVISSVEELALLNAQRERRPNSPHLAIYQPQLTWYLSSLNRITGVALSGALYAGAMLYLLHPLYPSIDSAHLIQLVSELPTWAKVSGKFVLALPFTFHSFNGIRHLVWDMNKAMTLRGVYATGYAVLAATAISSLYLASI